MRAADSGPQSLCSRVMAVAISHAFICFFNPKYVCMYVIFLAATNAHHIIARSSASTDRPCDAICQAKAYQLLHNSVETTCMTSPEQSKVMELEGYNRPTYNKFVHSAMMRSTIVGAIHKLTVSKFVDYTNTPTTCCGEIF